MGILRAHAQEKILPVRQTMTKHHEWTTLAMRNSFKRAAGIYSGYKTHQQSLATALKYVGGCPELLPPVAEPVCAPTEGEGR